MPKKLLFTILLLTFIVNFSSAQLKKSKKNGKYGFVDKNGKTVIEHKYDYAEDFLDRWELAEVKKGEKNYFLDKTGNEYLLAHSVNDITSETEAFFFVFKELKEIPVKIFECKNLKVLILRANKITKIPPEISALSHLKILDLSENAIKVIPSEIGYLTELTYLDIFSNYINKLPKEIGKLSKLEYFCAGSLGSVRLETLPPEFGNLSSLKKLDLRFCNFVKLPKELGKLTKLTELDLWSTGTLDFGSLSDAFQNFSKKVIISENVEDYFYEHPETLVIFAPYIDSFEALKIKNLVELQTYFDGNIRITKAEIDFLKGVEPKTKEELTAHKEILKSKSINWSNMRLSKVPEKILMLDSLEVLDLSDNNLLEFPEHILLQMKGLKKLNISGNPIIMLSEKAMAFIEDKKLMPVDSVAKYNVDAAEAFKEKGLTRLPDILWEQEYLAELYLNDNKLSHLPKEVARIKELSVLNLNNNQLSQLPNELGKMEHLSELYLENNQLTELPDFSKLQSLVILNLINNKLTSVTKSLKKLKFLEKLDLRGNTISEIEIKKLKKWMPDCEIVF